MKKASSRNPRGNKGLKVKHILQICVLLGVCIWLIYQVKYSHDKIKKKEFYDKDGEKSSVLESESKDGLVKLGRKDLFPKHVDEVEDDNEEEEIRDEVKESSKSKVEEEEEEEVVEDDENKQGGEEDEIDEQDQSKTDEEDEKEETNHVDEARDEHYKADDASSAVSHESRILNNEKLRQSSNETTQESSSNATRSEVETHKEPILTVVNYTTTEVSVNGNAKEAILEATVFLKNETEIMRDRSQEGSPPTVVESNPNITLSVQDESRNSTTDSPLLENISTSNTTGEVKEESSRSEGGEYEESGEKESSNEQRGETEETGETEEVEGDTRENSMQEEMEALTDPQTLPDIRLEGNEEDEEEETITTE